METGISIRPMQWRVLPELEAAPELDASDVACMTELRDVLARHGKLDRFALHLAHRHFELAPGEVLIERPDDANRTQHVTVARLVDEPAARPTTWLFEAGPELRLGEAVFCVCASDQGGGHTGRHGKSAVNPRAEEIARYEKRIGEENAGLEQGKREYARKRSIPHRNNAGEREPGPLDGIYLHIKKLFQTRH